MSEANRRRLRPQEGRRCNLERSLRAFSKVHPGMFVLTAVLAVAQEAPTFRSSTELVQVSVIAEDKQGKPVVDLRREEFQVFDNGLPQEIRLFLSETEKSDLASHLTSQEPKTPAMFTNEAVSRGGARSGYSAIVFDTLFTGFACETGGCGTVWAVRKALQTLRTLPADENVAIYATGYRLWAIREFTKDRESLERHLRTWRPTLDSILEENKPAILGDEISQMVEHLAGIPGRKSLIWIADRFPIGPASVKKLKAADIALYPVDAAGSTIALRSEKVARSAPLRALAAMTGGVAYFDRDDLDVAIREAVEDGHGYTLGFYPSGDSRASQVHQLTVRVSRPGVTPRYRTSYQLEAPRPVPANPKLELVRAMNLPTDETAIPIRASVSRTLDRLNLDAILNVASLDLAPKQNLWSGRIEVVARFTRADGIVAGDVFSQTVILNLRQTSYDKAVRGGVVYHSELKIPRKAVEVKLLFANVTSGKIGTLTIPLSEVGGSVASAK
jgi:VWFA-related protein